MLVSILENLKVSPASAGFQLMARMSGTTNKKMNEKRTDVIENVPSGEYYVRVGGKTNNAIGRYNYSKVFKVTIH